MYSWQRSALQGCMQVTTSPGAANSTFSVIHSATHSFTSTPACTLHSYALTGQGVNSALEDVCVLEQQVFDKSAGDLNQALPAFEQMRLPDSAALVKLVQVCFAYAVKAGGTWFGCMG
jgi:hypothetical protein